MFASGGRGQESSRWSGLLGDWLEQQYDVFSGGGKWVMLKWSLEYDVLMYDVGAKCPKMINEWIYQWSQIVGEGQHGFDGVPGGFSRCSVGADHPFPKRWRRVRKIYDFMMESAVIHSSVGGSDVDVDPSMWFSTLKLLQCPLKKLRAGRGGGVLQDLYGRVMSSNVKSRWVMNLGFGIGFDG
ncbi:hypothetical protein Tco_0746387 [Tanacetum coccineum]